MATKFYESCPEPELYHHDGSDTTDCDHCYECPECGASELAGDSHDEGCSYSTEADDDTPEESEKLSWFGVVSISNPGSGKGEVEFRAKVGCRQYVAYGTYESIDEYAVVHGPTQDDVDTISRLLDDGCEPASEATEL